MPEAKEVNHMRRYAKYAASTLTTALFGLLK
jgi:hypothetical protein